MWIDDISNIYNAVEYIAWIFQWTVFIPTIFHSTNKRYNALYDQILLIGTKWKEKYNYNLMFFSFAISISFKSIASYPGVKNVNFHMKQGACESLTHWYVIVKRGSLSKASCISWCQIRHRGFQIGNYFLRVLTIVCKFTIKCINSSP